MIGFYFVFVIFVIATAIFIQIWPNIDHVSYISYKVGKDFFLIGYYYFLLIFICTFVLGVFTVPFTRQSTIRNSPNLIKSEPKTNIMMRDHNIMMVLYNVLTIVQYIRMIVHNVMMILYNVLKIARYVLSESICITLTLGATS